MTPPSQRVNIDFRRAWQVADWWSQSAEYHNRRNLGLATESLGFPWFWFLMSYGDPTGGQEGQTGSYDGCVSYGVRLRG